jgi:fascin 1/2
LFSGVDVTANQDEVSDKETFQMEFNKTEKKWRFRTVDNKLWTIGQHGGIQAIADVA